LYAAGQRVRRDSYYGAEMDPNAYGDTRDIMTSAGGQYDINLKNNSTIMLGIDNNFNKLKDIKFGTSGNPNSTIVNQYINTVGTFAQYDMRFERVKTTIGLRYDNYWIKDLNDQHVVEENKNLKGDVLAPRINVLYDLTSSWQFRISYAKGYRTPQIFDEDLHIEASGARRILHANSPDLTQETSHNLTSSFRYTNVVGLVQTELLAEGFYTRLLDPFAYEYFFNDTTEELLKYRKNADDDACVAGINLELNAAFPNELIAQLGYTIQKSRYETPQAWGDDPESVTEQFLRTPRQYGYLTLDYHGIRNFDITLTSTHTGSMYIPHYGLDPITNEERELINSGDISSIDPGRQDEITAIINGDVIEGQQLEKSEHFLTLDFRVAYDISLSDGIDMQLYTGIQNIFNQLQANYDSGVYRDSGYVYGASQPRTISVGMKIGNLIERH